MTVNLKAKDIQMPFVQVRLGANGHQTYLLYWKTQVYEMLYDFSLDEGSLWEVEHGAHEPEYFHTW